MMATVAEMAAVMDAWQHLDFRQWPVTGREPTIRLSKDAHLVYSEFKGRFYVSFQSSTDWAEARILVIGIRRFAKGLVIECETFNVVVHRED